MAVVQAFAAGSNKSFVIFPLFPVTHLTPITDRSSRVWQTLAATIGLLVEVPVFLCVLHCGREQSSGGQQNKSAETRKNIVWASCTMR